MNEKKPKERFDVHTEFEPARALIETYQRYSGWKTASIQIKRGNPSHLFPDRDSYLVIVDASDDPREEVDFVGSTFYTTKVRQERHTMTMEVLLGKNPLYFDVDGRPTKSCLGAYDAKQNILACIGYFKAKHPIEEPVNKMVKGPEEKAATHIDLQAKVDDNYW